MKEHKHEHGHEHAGEEELRRGVMQLRMLESQLASIQQQMVAVDAAIVELVTTKDTIGTMREQKSDVSSLVPIGSGVFAGGILKKSGTVLIDVGAGVVMEKELEAAIAILDKREKELRNSLDNFQKYMASLERQYSDLNAKLQELAQR